MFNFHTHNEDTVPFLLNCYPGEINKEAAAISVGLHPWQVSNDWKEKVDCVRNDAMNNNVWAIGECGLDKLRGGEFALQIEAFKAQIAISEELCKPMIIHCVKAFDEVLRLRQELVTQSKHERRHPQPWVVHGFRGKPEQAKQIMAKGILLSFSHQYNIETLRFVFTCGHPFFLETDDRRLSVRQTYEQACLHLGVSLCHLENLCDPRQTIFHHGMI